MERRTAQAEVYLAIVKDSPEMDDVFLRNKLILDSPIVIGKFSLIYICRVEIAG